MPLCLFDARYPAEGEQLQRRVCRCNGSRRRGFLRHSAVGWRKCCFGERKSPQRHDVCRTDNGRCACGGRGDENMVDRHQYTNALGMTRATLRNRDTFSSHCIVRTPSLSENKKPSCTTKHVDRVKHFLY